MPLYKKMVSLTVYSLRQDMIANFRFRARDLSALKGKVAFCEYYYAQCHITWECTTWRGYFYWRGPSLIQIPLLKIMCFFMVIRE